MNKMKRIFTFTLVAISALSCAEQSPTPSADDGRYNIYGQGTKSCGSWTSESGDAEITNEVWVLGFISGAGWRGHRMRETDFAGIVASMKRHCEQFPADTIAEGAVAVAEQLAERSTR